MLQGLFVILRNHFSGIDSRHLYCLTQILLGLIHLRTVNLTELALVVELNSNVVSSRYRRLQRFFSNCSIDSKMLAGLMMQMFSDNKVTLCLDRTNWMFGKTNINILVLAIAYKNIAVPVMWSFLAHKGNSDYEHRVSIMQRFIELFGVERINVLLADREFVGDDWFKWLDSQGIHFIIRVRGNMAIGRARGELTSANHLVHALKPHDKIALSGRRRITQDPNAIKLYVAACRNSKGELIVVVSNAHTDDALEKYKVRWEIECLFGCLKTRGFNFESTHISIDYKIDTMLSALTIAFAWAYKIGEWKNELTPIKFKKHLRKSVSFFRYGLDVIRETLLNNASRIINIDLLDDRVWKKISMELGA